MVMIGLIILGLIILYDVKIIALWDFGDKVEVMKK